MKLALYVKVQLNCSVKASSSFGIASSVEISRPSSRLSEVTPFPTIPHGTMLSNQLMSVLQLRAKPWEVMYRPQWIPTKQDNYQHNTWSHSSLDLYLYKMYSGVLIFQSWKYIVETFYTKKLYDKIKCTFFRWPITCKQIVTMKCFSGHSIH